MNDIICKHNVTKRKVFTAEMFAIAIVLAILFIHPAANLWAILWGQPTTPESFSPAVNNISIVKTIKDGGPD